MIAKKTFIALGLWGTNILLVPLLDSTSTYFTISVRWYVPCPDKYRRWSSIFRILTVELWLVLIRSMVMGPFPLHLLGDTAARRSGKGIRH